MTSARFMIHFSWVGGRLFGFGAGERFEHRIALCDALPHGGLVRRQLGVTLPALAFQSGFAPLEVLACGIGMGLIDLCRRHRQQHDAVDRAGGHAKFAAGAVVGDDGVHHFGCAHDRVHRAGLDALGATNAIGLDDARQRTRLLDTVIRVERYDRSIQQRGEPLDACCATGRALIDRCFTARYGFGIRSAAVVSALLTLRLRQDRINAVGERLERGFDVHRRIVTTGDLLRCMYSRLPACLSAG
ncbi:hypothetical protein HDE78_002707 [Rhodanobacter sp. K2T2]|nr:hypothetical protein [Rhodanobacter sp. K2T2]